MKDHPGDVGVMSLPGVGYRFELERVTVYPDGKWVATWQGQYGCHKDESNEWRRHGHRKTRERV